VFTAALRAAGCEPDSFMAEYGGRQYEFTVDVAEGIRAADRAVVAREMARATAHRLGHRAIFSPVLDPAGVGNGVHIHFSFKDEAGTPVMHDPAGRLGLSGLAQHFVAGILHHQPALCALTAPATISYIRLRPNRWAPTHANLEQQDRAAALRVCPVIPGPNVARQFNVEYRVADGAASPYIARAAVVWAGVDGIRRGLAIPDEGPALPGSLDAALDALEASQAARDWMGESFHGAYLMHKRGEAAMMAGLTEAEQCARYAATY
jgi:glutamine synthetase